MGSSSASQQTESESKISDRRVVADQFASVSAPEFSPKTTIGKGATVDMATTIISTDNGATAAGRDVALKALGTADNAVNANSVVSMFAVDREGQTAANAIAASERAAAQARESADAAIAAARRSAADASAAAQRSAEQSAAASRAAASQASASSAASSQASADVARNALTNSQVMLGDALGFVGRSDALHTDALGRGFDRLLSVGESLVSGAQRDAAAGERLVVDTLSRAQDVTAQAYETARTTAAGALDQKTIAVIVLSGAAVLGLLVARRRG